MAIDEGAAACTARTSAIGGMARLAGLTSTAGRECRVVLDQLLAQALIEQGLILAVAAPDRVEPRVALVLEVGVEPVRAAPVGVAARRPTPTRPAVLDHPVGAVLGWPLARTREPVKSYGSSGAPPTSSSRSSARRGTSTRRPSRTLGNSLRATSS